MTAEEIVETLSTATQAALETVAFIISMPNEEDVPAPPRAMSTATVTFTGPQAGALTVRFPTRLLPMLAANTLGADDEPSPELQRDALGEIVNIIAGNILPSICGDTGKFRLKHPLVVEGEGAEVPPHAVTISLPLEGEYVEVILVFDAALQAATAP